MTIDLDTTDVKQVEFVIRMGSYSSSTTCQRPDNAGETVVVQYSDNGGRRDGGMNTHCPSIQPVYIYYFIILIFIP